MKTSININLFGTIYAIDEDARQLLDQYLSSLRSYFSKQQGGEEIADDIEHRVAEHFWNLKQQGTESISIEQVTKIMHEIGNPEEMGNADDAPKADTNAKTQTQDAPHREETSHDHVYGQDNQKQDTGDYSSRQGQRQFFRDPRQKILGGVLAGACHYFGWEDPLVLRILFVVLSFLTEGLLFWLYLLFWVISPAAVTTEQRLKMQGKPVNPDTIRSEVLNSGSLASAPQASSNGGCLKLLLGIALAPLGCLTVFVIFLIGTVLFGLGAGFMGMSGGLLSSTVSSVTIWAFILCLIAIIALPIYLLWRWLHKDSGKVSGLTVVILAGLWILAILLGFRFGKEVKDGISSLNWGSNTPFSNVNVSWSQSVTNEDDEEDSGDYTLVSVADFDKIDFAGVGLVEFNQDDQCRVEITGSEQQIRHTLITSEDGTLKIEPDEEVNEKDSKLKIKITAPVLKKLSVKGVGTFCINNLQQEEPLAISMEGVGKISAEYLACPTIELEQEGVGVCEYNVETDDLKVKIEGVGKMILSGHAKCYDRQGDQLLNKIEDEGLTVDN